MIMVVDNQVMHMLAVKHRLSAEPSSLQDSHHLVFHCKHDDSKEARQKEKQSHKATRAFQSIEACQEVTMNNTGELRAIGEDGTYTSQNLL